MATRKTSRTTRTTRTSRTARKTPTRAKTTRPAARKAAKAASASPMDRKIRPGFISHTEIASADPAATKDWAVKAFGWKFGDSMPMPDGSQYHMWQFEEGTGGGIRANNPPEAPGTVPYVEVPNIKAAYAKALKAGAAEMMAPMQVPGSGGWIAIVKEPGGAAIGLWGMK
jgi:predicted enzyme related to lactoylglutathione lyase